MGEEVAEVSIYVLLLVVASDSPETFLQDSSGHIARCGQNARLVTPFPERDL